MAYEEHLEILRKGVAAAAWNEWRKANPGVWPDLSGANLSAADLSAADFSDADLIDANLNHANLIGANLIGANLNGANLSAAMLRGADLRSADLWSTFFTDLDLRQVEGLESVEHRGPSPVSTSTLERSHGQISVAFLRGCGLSDWEIEAAQLWNPDLTEEQITSIFYEVIRLRGQYQRLT